METNDMNQTVTIRTIWSLLVDFIKNPRIMPIVPNWNFRTFGLLLLITFLVIIPYAMILELIDLDQFDHMMEELLKENKLLVIILAIIIAPLLEETIFRYHLNLKKNAIIISLILSVMAISEYWYLVVSFMVYLVYLYFRANKGVPISMKWAVFISSFFFALVHMGNFKDFDFLLNFYWIPLLVAVQFFIGLVLSFIRLHYGLAMAIIFHATYNAILVIPAVYFLEI